MDVRECLLTRRSIRKYKDDPIPDEVLERIMEGTLAAPSASNRQHWYFVVVRTPQGMAELHEVMAEMKKEVVPHILKKYERFPQVAAEAAAFLQGFGRAPVCVLAFYLRQDFAGDEGMQSVSAAIENLLLAAWSEGVGSCWMAAPKGIGSLLEEKYAPDKGEFIAAVSLGYPERVPDMPPRKSGRCVYL